MEKLSLKEGIQLLTEFCEANKRLPRHKGPGHPESILSNFMIKYKNISEAVDDIRKRYRRSKSLEESYIELVEFCKTHKRLPRKLVKGTESRLYSILNKHRYDPKISALVDKYRTRRHLPKELIKSWDESIKDLEEFCKIHRRLPRSDRFKDELRLSNFKNRHRNHPEIVRIVEKYRFKAVSKTYDQTLIDFKEFLIKNNRLPVTTRSREETRLQGFMRRFRYKKKEVSDLIDQYRYYNAYTDNLKLLIEFTEINKRLPRYNSKDKNEFRLCSFMKRHENYTEVNELMIKFNAI